MKTYIQQIRSKLGKDKFIHPGARIIIENQVGEFLIIERADNGQFGIPAGAMEEHETIEECIIREVKEETGLLVEEVEVIGISSNPIMETVQYRNGDIIQYFTVEFYANKWTGKIKISDKEEVKRATFRNKAVLEKLPKNERSAFESLHYYRINNKIMVK